MVKEADLKWRKHYENNIPTNPLGAYYCLIDLGNSARKYGIVPQYPSNDGVVVDMTKDPELFILFESIGRKATDDDRQAMFYESVNYDGYLFDHDGFIRAFRTIEEAKSRAYVQYKAVFGYALSYIRPDIEEATKEHFCV